MTATRRFTLTLLLIVSTFAFAADTPFDIVIGNGHIVDGTGSPWYSGDIGIRDGRIAAIGDLSGAARQRTVDAKGKIVAPGFIDMLGQSEITILVDPRLPSKIYQGITTEITGEGDSVAPLNDAIIANNRTFYEHYKIDPDWRPSANISRVWKNKGWASISPATWARPRCGAWCWATPTCNPRPSNSRR